MSRYAYEPETIADETETLKAPRSLNTTLSKDRCVLDDISRNCARS